MKTNTQVNENSQAVKKRKFRWKRAIITGAITVTLIGGAVFGINKGINQFMDAWGAESVVDTATSEQLDDIGAKYAKDAKDKGFLVTSEWDDAEIQDVIHQMSHQKVIADRKWGAIEITPARLITMDRILEQNKMHLEFYDTYREILDRWIHNDFSEADADHNEIWYLQGGTVGKATGVLSEQEEKEYIQAVFKGE